MLPPACKFDFEDGIDGWVRTGTVFNNQPTYGDNPTARNKGQPANQQGDWWIGGFEHRPSPSVTGGQVQGDGPQGTLTSPRFDIIGQYISFLIGGGCDINLMRTELIVNSQVGSRYITSLQNRQIIFWLPVLQASTLLPLVSLASESLLQLLKFTDFQSNTNQRTLGLIIEYLITLANLAIFGKMHQN